MSKNVLSRRRDPYELLERMLNETSLTTKRAHHGHIIGWLIYYLHELSLCTALRVSTQLAP